MSSLANDIFFSLSRGMKFKKKSNEEAKSLFIRDRNETRSSQHGKRGRSSSNSLDFFASTAPSNKTTAPSDKLVDKRKKRSKDESNRDYSEYTQKPERLPEEITAFRRKMKIKVVGNDVPDPLSEFSTEDLISISVGARNGKRAEIGPITKIARLLKYNIENSAYKEPTPIQMQSMPSMLYGRDVLACAPTGSGKTAAFLIPLIMQLQSPMKVGSKSKVRALIIAPTRELASQILREFEKLSKGKKFHAFVLNKSIAKQTKISADLLITTPLRMVHCLKTERISLDAVENLILDEADRLFELGFLEQVDEILAACTNSKMRRSLFSATIPPQIEDLAKTILRDPVKISIGTSNAAAETINQRLIFVGKEEGKLMAIRQIVQDGLLKPPALIFVQSKERAKELYQELIYDGIKVDAVHAERTQNQRDQIVKRFRTGEIWVLICTDLMGRGIDFKGVNCVINYDLPTSAISYIHRIGRTGRAGRKGEAITLYTLDDVEYLRSIANVMRLSGSKLEKWMTELKMPSTRKKKKMIKNPQKRNRIATTSDFDLKRRAKKRNIVRQSKTKKSSQSS